MICEIDFNLNLQKDAAIILANMKFENNENHYKEVENNEYILLENPINRINEIHY